MRAHVAGTGLLLLAFACGIRAARADEARVTAAFDELEVRPDGMADYTVTISGSELPEARPGRDEPRPDFSAFDVLGGPSQGSSTQVSIVNGRMASERSISFTWRLAPKGGAEGELTVPAFRTSFGDLELRVPAASIRSSLRAAGSSGRSGGRSAPWDPFERPRSARSAPDENAHLEVVAEVDADDVWLGQEVIVTHLVEFSPEVVVRRFDPEPAEFPGFEKQVREVDHRGRRVPGRNWQEAPLAQWRLVPLTAGDKELPAQAYVLHVQGRSRDFFDGFFGGGEQRLRRATRPVPLRVRPLPADAPPSFSGAVGSFQVESSIGASRLAQGDGTTMRFVVKGTGNFGPVKAPPLVLPSGVRSFDPEVREDTRPGRDGRTTGAKIFEYPLLVEAAGRLEIPPVRWSYFDPQSGRYVSRETRPMSLEVEASETPVPVLGAAGGSRPVETLDTDIHHVRSRWEPASAPSRAGGLPAWFWPLVALGPLLPVASLAWRLRARLARRDPVRERERRAGAEARKRAAAALAAARAGRTQEALDGASRAVGRFVVDRLGRGGAAPAPAEVERLVADAAGAGLAARVKAHLNDCDFLRFAGAGDRAARASELAEQARSLVAELESSFGAVS